MAVNTLGSMKPIVDETTLKDEGQVTEAADSTEVDVEDFADTVVWESDKKLTENGEGSVQIDVESLVAEFEAEATEGVDANGRIRRKLEAITERKRRHEELEDFECEIHLDINPNKKHNSSIVIKEATGYVMGMTGMEAKAKPEAFAASYCADWMVRNKGHQNVTWKH